jgi:hypothetical protein
MTQLPYQLDRTVEIQASRETVFRFFTDSVRWAKWWGAGSRIEARPEAKFSSAIPAESKRRAKSSNSLRPSASSLPTDLPAASRFPRQFTRDHFPRVL